MQPRAQEVLLIALEIQMHEDTLYQCPNPSPSMLTKLPNVQHSTIFHAKIAPRKTIIVAEIFKKGKTMIRKR